MGHFLPFYLPPPLMIPNIKILKKTKKRLEILSFYTDTCTINADHMIYGSWNIRCNRQKFLTFWAIFCPFSSLTTWEIKILTLKKTPRDIIILHICTTIWCMVPEIWNVTDITFCHSGLFFYPFTPPPSPPSSPPMDPENQNFQKNGKNTWWYYHLTNINDSHMIYVYSDMECNKQNFFVILDHFLPFYPAKYIFFKILKKWKIAWRCHFTQV